MPRLKPARIKIKRQWRVSLEDYVIDLAWSPGGDYLLAAGVSGSVALYRAADGHLLQTYTAHDLGTTALAWFPDGSGFATAGQDGHIRFWGLENTQATQELAGGTAWVEHLAWSPSGQILASAAGRHLRLWSRGGELLQSYPPQNSTIADLAWKPGQEQLAVATYGTLRLFDPQKADFLREFTWKGSILTLAWSPDGRFIATGDQDSTVHFWYEESGEDLQMWGYATKVRELAWNASSRYLATGGGLEVVIWDCRTSPAGTKPQMLTGHAAFVSALAYQGQGDILASGDEKGGLLLWQPESSDKALYKAKLSGKVSQLCWSPDHQGVAAACETGEIVLTIIL
jgi:WD40 repeat protein